MVHSIELYSSDAKLPPTNMSVSLIHRIAGVFKFVAKKSPSIGLKLSPQKPTVRSLLVSFLNLFVIVSEVEVTWEALIVR